MSMQLRERAWSHHQRGELREAEATYRQLIKLGLRSNGIVEADAINLGALLRQQGRLKDACHHYKLCLEEIQHSEGLYTNAINAHIELQQYSQARTIGETGLKNLPNNLTLQEAIGRALIASGQYTEAQNLFNALLQHRPREFNYLIGLGQTQFYQQQWLNAEATFRLLIKYYPSNEKAYLNLITTLKQMGKFQAAEQHFAELPVALRNHPEVISSYAGLLMAEQRFEDAESLLAQACENNPGNAANWLNRSACLRNLKHNVACHGVLKQGLLLHPADSSLQQAFAQSLAELGRGEAAIKLLMSEYDKQVNIDTDQLINVQFLGMGYQLLSSEQCREIAQNWESAVASSSPGPLWGDRQRDWPLEPPLRIGYLSADFCNHPVGRFLLPVLQQHDRQKVSVVGLNLCPHDDAVQAQFRGTCDQWIDLQFSSDLEAARKISDLQLDVLIELGGFTGLSRPGILVHRPAPVQLSYLGYCGPTFLSCVDGWIGDATLFANLNRVDSGAHALHHLAGGYMAYVPQGLPELQAPEQQRCFRFGCFNHSRKLSDQAIRLFIRVMEQIPQAELMLKSITFVEAAERERMRKRFIDQGLDPTRLVLQPWIQGWENHMSLYSHIDVALDPLPYSGATTTCEALLMGVPVVSLAGEAMVERLSASVLAGAGFPEWIATTPNNYVAIATALAKCSDQPRSLSKRQLLRHQVQGSNLGQPNRVARELEQLFLQLRLD